MKSYSDSIQNLRRRYNPNGGRIVVANENYSIANDSAPSVYDDLHEYVQEAMYEVDQTYTEQTKKSGEEIKKILSSWFTGVDFKYQGSVMTDTHIRGASDIDLLCLQDNQLVSGPYGDYYRNGNPVAQTSQKRNECLQALHYALCHKVYQAAKSIQVYRLSTSVKVDVVNGIWNTSYNCETGRIVTILNAEKQVLERGDYPFLSIARINQRSAETNGRLKRMIRFLKNLREDSDTKIKLNSFQINSICYGVPVESYQNLNIYGLVDALTRFLYNHFITGAPSSILSVTGVEYPFRDNPLAVANVKDLYGELYPIWKTLHDMGDVK